MEQTIEPELRRGVYSNGKVLLGLAARREAETPLILHPRLADGPYLGTISIFRINYALGALSG